MVAPYIATALMRFVLLFLILAWMVAKSHDSKTCYWLIGLSLCKYWGEKRLVATKYNLILYISDIHIYIKIEYLKS